MDKLNSLFEISETKKVTSDISYRPTPASETFVSDGNEESNETFFKIISHELRTPINVVLGSIQLFEMIGDDLFTSCNRNKLISHNNIMKQNCYRLLRSVNNLIDMSKLSSGNLGLCVANHDLVSTFKEIVAAAQSFASGKNLNIQFASDNDRIIVACDKDKISRALLNLISNAIKFTAEGGNILIHIRQKEDKLYISVMDNGIGIPQDQLQHIFKQFYQVEKGLTRTYEGSGVGLTIAELIVKLHQGNIKVNSIVNKGSNFTIELPLTTTVTTPCSKTFALEHSLSANEMINVELSDLF